MEDLIFKFIKTKQFTGNNYKLREANDLNLITCHEIKKALIPQNNPNIYPHDGLLNNPSKLPPQHNTEVCCEVRSNTNYEKK